MRKKAWIIFGIVMIVVGLYVRIISIGEDTGDYELAIYTVLQYGAYIIGVISLIYGLVNSEQQLEDKAEEERRRKKELEQKRQEAYENSPEAKRRRAEIYKRLGIPENYDSLSPEEQLPYKMKLLGTTYIPRADVAHIKCPKCGEKCAEKIEKRNLLGQILLDNINFNYICHKCGYKW